MVGEVEVCAAPFKLLGDVDVGGVDVVCVGAGFVLPPPPPPLPPLQLLLELTVVVFVVVVVVLFVVASIVAVVDDVMSGPFRRGGDVFGWFVGVVDAVGTAIVGALLVGVVADVVVGVVDVVVVVVVVVGGDFCWFSRLGLDTGPIMPFFEIEEVLTLFYMSYIS